MTEEWNKGLNQHTSQIWWKTEDRSKSRSEARTIGSRSNKTGRWGRRVVGMKVRSLSKVKTTCKKARWSWKSCPWIWNLSIDLEGSSLHNLHAGNGTMFLDYPEVRECIYMVSRLKCFCFLCFVFFGMDFLINQLCNYSFSIVLIIRIPFVTKVSSVL